MSESTMVPTEQEVLERIVAIAREHLDEAHRFEGPLADLGSRRLVADLGLDSVELLTLAMEVENHFQVILDVDPLSPPEGPEGAESAVETVAELVATVRAALAQRERPGEGGS